VGPLTEDEIQAHEKGYGHRFYNYVDLDEPIRISAEHYAQLVAWCEPYMARRHEVQGGVTFHLEATGLTIERVYVMGGNSVSLPTTCKSDPEDMMRQMQVDYPDWTLFWSDRVGWWHLHPGYYPSLSVGDVEECRATLRAADADENTRVLHLLMYGDGRGYQLSGYLIGLDEVNRLPVRIQEPTEVD
jgi:hypothetical protein